MLSYRKSDRVIPIKYITQLDKSKPVFKGQDGDGQMIIVKFTDRYNAIGHRLLAEHGLAPKLLHISSENGDPGHFGYRVMVVMEFLDGQTAEEFGLVMSKPRSIRGAVHSDVERAIKILHDADLVFGDLRKPNIMIVNGRGKLVDFDWCGRGGQDRYPRDLNTQIKWPSGVTLGGLMYKDHDLQMMTKIFSGTAVQDVIKEEE
jgi:serine/threonine protein kinase